MNRVPGLICYAITIFNVSMLTHFPKTVHSGSQKLFPGLCCKGTECLERNLPQRSEASHDYDCANIERGRQIGHRRRATETYWRRRQGGHGQKFLEYSCWEQSIGSSKGRLREIRGANGGRKGWGWVDSDKRLGMLFIAWQEFWKDSITYETMLICSDS
jgi:hypothetical protein